MTSVACFEEFVVRTIGEAAGCHKVSIISLVVGICVWTVGTLGTAGTVETTMMGDNVSEQTMLESASMHVCVR